MNNNSMVTIHNSFIPLLLDFLSLELSCPAMGLQLHLSLLGFLHFKVTTLISFKINAGANRGIIFVRFCEVGMNGHTPGS